MKDFIPAACMLCKHKGWTVNGICQWKPGLETVFEDVCGCECVFPSSEAAEDSGEMQNKPQHPTSEIFKDKTVVESTEPDNLYDGAILLLRSWAACMGNRPSDWQEIAANLLTDTQALLHDEAEREESVFASTPTVRADLATSVANLSPDLYANQRDNGWLPIEIVNRDIPVLLYSPPENLYLDPQDRLPDVRLAKARDFTWATHWQPFRSPSKPVQNKKEESA